MNEQVERSCAAGCCGCKALGVLNECPPADAPVGWRLTLPCAWSFLLPPAAAIAGAGLAGGSAAMQLGCGLAGLVAGIAVAWGLSYLFRRRLKESA